MKRIKFLGLMLSLCLLFGGVSILATGCGETTLSLTLHEASAATCEESGNIAYYEDEDSGKFYADENGKTELSWSEIEIAALGHDLSFVDGVAATCEASGTLEHYACSRCTKVFSDVEGANVLSDLTISALGHDYDDAKFYAEGELYASNPAGYYQVCKNDSTHFVYQNIEATAVATEAEFRAELAKVTSESELQAESVRIVLTADVSISGNCSKEVLTAATIDLNGHKLTFSMEKVSTSAALYVSGSGATLTIEDNAGSGVIENMFGYGIMAYDNATIIVNGGTFNTWHSCLSCNNLKGRANFTINGGTFNSLYWCASIYMPSYGKLTINGGTFNSGLLVRMGEVEISGGTFNSFNPERYVNMGLATESQLSSGSYDTFEGTYTSSNIWFGNTVAFYVGAYTFKENGELVSNALSVSITGGTFNNDNSDTATGTTANNTVQIYVAGNVSQEVNISITNGNFTSANGADISVVEGTSSMKTYENGGSGNVTNAISLSVADGLFTSDVSAYLS